LSGTAGVVAGAGTESTGLPELASETDGPGGFLQNSQVLRVKLYVRYELTKKFVDITMDF
jgi:hypothetical protein